MRLKECKHPEPRRLDDPNSKIELVYCAECGALGKKDASEWTTTGVRRDFRRWLIIDPESISPLAERRAWESFVVANLPFAGTVVAANHLTANNETLPIDDPRFDDLVNALAARMADRMMDQEWNARFAPPEGAGVRLREPSGEGG